LNAGKNKTTPDAQLASGVAFAEEKSSLVRVTSMIFRTLVDVPPAHAGLLRKSQVWFV